MPRFRLAEFKSLFADKGVALDTQFMMSIPCKDGETKLTLDMAAHAVDVPGLNFDTTVVRRDGVGSMRTHPLAPQYTDTTVLFYLDQDGYVLDFFQSWLRQIFPSKESSDNPHLVLEYKKTYARDIELKLYRRDTQSYATYNFINAWPVYVGTMQVQWRNESSILVLPVRFNMDRYDHMRGQTFNPVLSGNEQQTETQETLYTNAYILRDIATRNILAIGSRAVDNALRRN